MIEVSNIKKTYGKKSVLKNIHFQVSCGECVAIVGRNGCGKTTLMQILAGIMKPDAGELRYFGKNPQKQRKYFHKFCGYVPQEMPLIEELSVKDNLRLWGANRSSAYERIMQSFQLEEIMKMPVGKLSGGMKRRLSIACALAEWPPVLLLDEPTTALDLYYKESIENWMQEYKKMNGMIIMTTHDEKEILGCDRCLVMWDGNLRELPQEQKNMQYIKSVLDR